MKRKIDQDLKKLIKFLLWVIFLFSIAYFIFIFGIVAMITSGDNISDFEVRGEKISNLIFCKKKFIEAEAQNPNIDYNYTYYLKSGQCPPPEKLQNIEEATYKFCQEIKEKNRRLYDRFFYVEKICK